MDDGTDVQRATPVSVSLQDLRSGSISDEDLLSAFGPSSLGILVVTDLPHSFSNLRQTVLSNSSHLAALPQPTLDTLSNKDAKYLVGWSHGKEQLRPGVVDTLKGSYYINCPFYQDPNLLAADAKKHPGFEEYTSPSVWPNESEGRVPGFRKAAEDLITLIIDTAVLVARVCDKYAQSQIQDYSPNYLEQVVRTSTTTKARLLHYFPTASSSSSSSSSTSSSHSSPASSAEHDSQDDWCSTHVDHGCLTGLTSAQFLDETLPGSRPDPTHPSLLAELDTSPDPKSGLYIKSRTGKVVKVSIPRDALAFQTGEALELITRGKFKAVPHFVRGAQPPVDSSMKIAWNTLAVFTQPNLDEIVDVEQGISFGEFARGVVKKNTAG